MTQSIDLTGSLAFVTQPNIFTINSKNRGNQIDKILK